MQPVLDLLTDPAFSPHGFCLAWNPLLIWLHVSADTLIALAYLGIATALAVFVSRRQDLALGWMFWMFAAFILACGMTHALEVMVLWYPAYGLQGGLKALTAIVSMATAVLLWPLIPRLLAMPTPAELRRANRDLRVAQAAKRETEAALRNTEHTFRLLVEGVKDHALFMLDTAGYVTTWNPGAARIEQMTAMEAIGEHFSRFFVEGDRASKLPDRMLQIAAREGRFEAEGWQLRKDGSRFWASAVLNALRDDAGRLLGFVRITRDLTEKRRAEETLEQTRAALAQSQKMEAVGQLTGGVAHDFNNLLTAILGNLELLERRFVTLDAEAKRLLLVAKGAARRGAELVASLLAFARKQTLMPRVTDVNRLVEDVSELLRRTLGEAVALRTVLAEDPWPTRVDPAQLENALLNLAVNARDAMPSGGLLTIETSKVVLDDTYAARHPDVAPGDYVAIAVTDTGSGMTQEVLERAFEPFFTTKPEGRGTGLGLSQVFGFIRQSGGHVTLHTRPGQGTTVRMVLPRNFDLPEPQSLQPADVPGQVGNGQIVLVVEDDADVRQFTEAAVAELGFDVRQAADADSALALIEREPGIALMFTDVGLPRIDGRQLAEMALRRRPDLKVLFTTGYTQSATIRSGGPGAGLHLIRKPFSMDELAAKLSELMGEAARAPSPGLT